MITKLILSSHPVPYLKKEIAKQHIKGYSTMKKSQVVELMLKHKHKFSHIKHNFATKSKQEKSAEVKTPPKQKPKEKEKKKKKRIAPTVISTTTTSQPMRSKGFGRAYDETLARLERTAKQMDESKKGRRLISNKPVPKSREPKTQNNYRTGRNFL